MKKNSESKPATKQKLVLRKESIKALDDVDLSLVAGGGDTMPPPDGGSPPEQK